MKHEIFILDQLSTQKLKIFRTREMSYLFWFYFCLIRHFICFGKFANSTFHLPMNNFLNDAVILRRPTELNQFIDRSFVMVVQHGLLYFMGYIYKHG